MRKLTTATARNMQAARKTRGGGRPRKPRACPKCGTLCKSTLGALGHCG
jgi:hypothetical protein